MAKVWVFVHIIANAEHEKYLAELLQDERHIVPLK